jgi:predicted lipoprotein with Yx(FWY)xxD motif
VNWPPLLTRGEPEAGEGVDASKLGTIPYEDDLMLVTYDGWPLYYWVNDMAPGDTTGQGVGDVWFVVDPAGVMMDDSSDDSSSMDSVSLEVGESDELGSFLVDGEGMTLYMFTNDEPGVSNCSGQCLENWPPFLTSGEVEAGEGVDDSKIDTIPFEGDQMLVTYDGYPLYYWANDTAPGDTTGQGVGDVWFVVSPDGVMMDDSSSMDAVQLEMAESDELGSFLVDSEGMTLYMFTNDEPGVSNCSGQCLENWPPFLTTGEVEAGDGVDDSKIDTIPFEGDQMLVTYDGYPLYYWVNDQEPGDTTGQGVGDVWFVVSPDGVMMDDTSMTDPSY